MMMKRFVLATCILLTAGCERHEARDRSVAEPAQYRPRLAQDENGRAVFTAGLSLPVPMRASVTYPQGIDSRLMHINGEGYTLQLSDYGAFMESATTKVAGAPASLQAGGRDDCRFRVWSVRLPVGSSTNLICSDSNSASCMQAPAQATISTFCNTSAACQQVDAVIADVRLLPKPWPQVPLPDPQVNPKGPVCQP